MSRHHFCSEFCKVAWLSHVTVLDVFRSDDGTNTHEHTEETGRSENVLSQGVDDTVRSTILQDGVTSEN